MLPGHSPAQVSRLKAFPPAKLIGYPRPPELCLNGVTGALAASLFPALAASAEPMLPGGDPEQIVGRVLCDGWLTCPGSVGPCSCQGHAKSKALSLVGPQEILIGNEDQSLRFSSVCLEVQSSHDL